jgi:Plant transposon protein
MCSMFDDLENSCASNVRILSTSMDTTGRHSISTRQKLAAVFRILVNGEAFDRCDKYLRISETTVRTLFTRHVVQTYESRYLCGHLEEVVKNIIQRFEAHGFLRCFGSIDCVKVPGKNCPVGNAGQYKGRENKPSILCEAIGDDNLVLTHIFFGMSGVNNDL